MESNPNKIIIELDANYNYNITVNDGVISIYNTILNKYVDMDTPTNAITSIDAIPSLDGIYEQALNKHLTTLTCNQIYGLLSEYASAGKFQHLNCIFPTHLTKLDPFGQSLLHLAVSNSNLEVTNFIIQKTGSELLNLKRACDQFTALHLSTHVGPTDVLASLINAFEKYHLLDLINTPAADGKTALHFAVDRGNLNACRMLYPLTSDDAICLDIGAYGGITTDNYYHTILHNAVKINNYSIVELLLSKEPIAKMLLSKLDKHGQNALHIAIYSSSFKISTLLIDRALQVYSDKETVKNFFLAKTTLNGYTPLHRATHASNNKIIEFLLGRVYKDIPEIVSVTDNHCQTPLHWAASKGKFDICQMLYPLMSSEDILLQSEKHKATALFLAVRAGHSSIVQLLLSRSEVADQLASITDNSGETPLQSIANKHEKEDVRRVLIDYFIRSFELWRYG